MSMTRQHINLPPFAGPPASNLSAAKPAFVNKPTARLGEPVGFRITGATSAGLVASRIDHHDPAHAKHWSAADPKRLYTHTKFKPDSEGRVLLRPVQGLSSTSATSDAADSLAPSTQVTSHSIASKATSPSVSPHRVPPKPYIPPTVREFKSGKSHSTHTSVAQKLAISSPWKRSAPFDIAAEDAKKAIPVIDVKESSDDGSDDEPSEDIPVGKPTVEEISKIHGYLSDIDIDKLLRQTNYSRRELYVLFGRFKSLCAMSGSPLGIDKQTFKQGIARLAVEDELFVNRVFEMVDADGSGCIEWEEFLTALAALEKGSQAIKTKFLMSVYDLDGDGYLSREDLGRMFLSSSMLAFDRTMNDVVTAFVDSLFEMLKVDTKISTQHIEDFMFENPHRYEDVWEMIGRSMLKDFSSRRGV